jgi:hypothetical protein
MDGDDVCHVMDGLDLPKQPVEFHESLVLLEVRSAPHLSAAISDRSNAVCDGSHGTILRLECYCDSGSEEKFAKSVDQVHGSFSLQGRTQTYRATGVWVEWG